MYYSWNKMEQQYTNKLDDDEWLEQQGLSHVTQSQSCDLCLLMF